MRMRKACACLAALVDQRVQIPRRLGQAPSLPGFADEVELVVRQVGDRTQMLRGVDDDLLPLERGIEVRDDANAPTIVPL